MACHDEVARSVVGRGGSSSERSGTLADDPFSGRQPTSHERLSGWPWDASYHDGPAPWDIGQPQPAIVRLASAGGFAGVVLDAGCGTGENALHVASLGLSVLGVDVAETALAIARAKADERAIDVEFAAADAFRLEYLGAGLRRCWTADCSTPSTARSDHDTWRARWNPVCVVPSVTMAPILARTPSVRNS
jgi:SAM-dependent methyltransferase